MCIYHLHLTNGVSHQLIYMKSTLPENKCEKKKETIFESPAFYVCPTYAECMAFRACKAGYYSLFYHHTHKAGVIVLLCCSRSKFKAFVRSIFDICGTTPGLGKDGRN